MTAIVRPGAAGFAICAEALLRKHGVAPVDTGAALTVIPAGTLEAGERLPSPCFLDGPVDPRVLTPLAIAAEPRMADQLALRSTGRGALGPLVYTRWLLRPKDLDGVRGEAYSLPTSPPWREVISYQALTAGGGWQPVLYASPPSGGEEIVGVSDGARLVVGLPLLDLLGSLMVWPPFDDGYFGVESAGVQPAVENWLIWALRQHALTGGAPWAQIDRWPDDARWALTVRHDYDRLLTDAELHELLDVYDELGVRSTWYLLRNRTVGRQARLLHTRRHEVALHTTARNHGEFRDEVAALQLEIGRPVRGVTAHGGSAIGYLGGLHIDWASAAKMRHGETIGRVSTLPFVAHRATPDGIQPADIVLLATHRSLDGGMAPDQHNLAQIVETVNRIAASGGYVVLMNHPDVHRAQLLEALALSPLSSVWRCTAVDMATWTRGAKYGASWRPQDADGHLSLHLTDPLQWPVTASIETPDGAVSEVLVPPGEVASVRR